MEQDVLVLDIELAKFEIEHFHDLFKITVTGFHHFLSLCKKEFDHMKLVGIKIECDNVKLAFVH